MEIKYGYHIHRNRELMGIITFDEPSRLERIMVSISWWLTRSLIVIGIIGFAVLAVHYELPLQPFIIAFVISFVMSLAAIR